MNTFHKTAIRVATIALLATGLFAVGSTRVEAADDCSNPIPFLIQASQSTLNRNGTATLYNSSSTCTFKVGLTSYKMFHQDEIDDQQYIASDVKMIGPHQTVSFQVPIPSCAYQLDLFWGDPILSFANGDRHGVRIIKWLMIQDIPFCTTTPPPPPTLTAACTNPANANVGDTVTWNGSATGGTGTYSYSWSGTNDLSGALASITKIYATSGTKTGTITVTSGNQTASAQCSTTISTPSVPQLTLSCTNPAQANVGDNVVWNSSVSGGTGTYTYSWSGSDGLSGSNASTNQTYSTSGTKTGTVHVVSGSMSADATCSTNIIQTQTNTITASCYASPNSINLNDSLTWISNVSGGNGAYTYAWSGTDNLNGSGNTTTHSYGSTGTKNASVVVTSGNQTATAQCTASVVQQQNNNFSVSCYANPSNATIGNSVNWYANVSGGSGSYSYSWNGAEGLSGSGSSVYQTYNYPGSKWATVTVNSNGQTQSATCNVTVQDNTNYTYYNYNYNNNLTGSCYAIPSNPQVGQSVTWYATASGGNNGSYNSTYNTSYYNNGWIQGQWNLNSQYNNSNNNGNYNFYWTGSDGLNGGGYGGNSITRVYTTPGYKTATVQINSNGQSVAVNCSTNVGGSYYTPPTYYPPTTGTTVTLNQVPYTGVGNTLKVVLFGVTLTAWSAFIAYLIVRKRALKHGVSVGAEVSEDISANIKTIKDSVSATGAGKFWSR